MKRNTLPIFITKSVVYPKSVNCFADILLVFVIESYVL